LDIAQWGFIILSECAGEFGSKTPASTNEPVSTDNICAAAANFRTTVLGKKLRAKRAPVFRAVDFPPVPGQARSDIRSNHAAQSFQV